MDTAKKPSRPDPFWTGFSLGILHVFSLANIFLLVFVVPKFGQIYADALPGKPLPVATSMILDGHLVILILNLAWMIFCIVLARSQSRRANLCTNLGTVWNILQAGITVIALYMPMVGDLTGMSGPHA